jgi:phosphate starvation-inducible PhoH-like protein
MFGGVYVPGLHEVFKVPLELAIPIEDPSRRSTLYGTADGNLRLIRTAFNVRISARDNIVHISGEQDAVRKAALTLETLQKSLRSRPVLTEDFVEESIRRAGGDGAFAAGEAIDVFLSSATIIPKGEGQRKYVESIRNCDLTFCLGPAGSGKTYLAVAVSVGLLKHHRIKRIVLARPAVEAGEKLGFLPGDMQAKVNPYLRPLYDAMHDMMTYDQAKRFMQNDVIEVVPLAFMRGRTLNHAAIILDEAQNATVSQMMMFLTRLGHDSKMIVTGDDSQSDLRGERNGAIDAVTRLDGTPGVAVVRLSSADIVRHPLVQRIVEAYGTPGRTNAGSGASDKSGNEAGPGGA